MKRIAFIFLSIVLLLLTVEQEVYSQKSKKVRQLETKRKELLDEINRTSVLIKETDKSKSLSLKRLNLLTRQVNARKEMILTLTSEIEVANQETMRLRVELDSLLIEFNTKQSSYVKSLQSMQCRGNVEEQLLFILSAKDFLQGLRRARYLQDYAMWQKDEALRIKDIHAKVKKKREAIEQQTIEKTNLLNQREMERENLQKSSEESRQEVNRLNQQKKELQAQLNKKRKQAQALNHEIEQQIAREVAAANKRAKQLASKSKTTKSKKKTTQKTPSQVQYQMNSDEVKLSGGFQNNKGRLPIPITGSYSIVGSFGEHAHESLSYVRINNNGIDIQGRPGAEARAVFEGVVTRIFVVEGYNNSIIIRHGNYLTVYSNITTVYVKSGDKVSAGQILGKVFADSELGGATLLHFQIWKERTKLNPKEWIRRS